jgi:hypothetical protein
MRRRRRFSAEFKEVALEAIKGQAGSSAQGETCVTNEMGRFGLAPMTGQGKLDLGQERLIGSIRRKCVDHIVILGEARRLLR